MDLFIKLSQRLFIGILIYSVPSIIQAQKERTVEINNHTVNVFTVGLQPKTASSPTIVFHSGSTVPIKDWKGVIDKLSTKAAVVAFDPPGIGKSEWNHQRPTMENKNQWLNTLLSKVNAPPPYVLVGHSWAGWLVRDYAGRYPDQTAGLVLIDPTQSIKEFIATFEEIGAGDSELKEFTEFMQRMMANAPIPIRARQSVISEYSNNISDPEVPAAPSVPTVVMVAGHYDNASLPDSLQPSFDLDEFLKVLRRRQTTSPIKWLQKAPKSLFTLANDSGHCIHCDDPNLVAWTIDRVLLWSKEE